MSRKLSFGQSKQSPLDRYRNIDEGNLRAALEILANRAKYDRPDARFMIQWAQLVIERHSSQEVRQAA